jgi:hypothetical protein
MPKLLNTKYAVEKLTLGLCVFVRITTHALCSTLHISTYSVHNYEVVVQREGC